MKNTLTQKGPFDVLGKAFGQYLEESRQRPVAMSLNKFGESARHYAKALESSQPADLAPFYRMQEILRPLFGKEGLRDPAIGHLPDFDKLKGTDDHAYCSIVTLFMDIQSSTRLSRLYALEQVRLIKNAFIRAAIEVITAFDGHVHRIMGDAVLAFFGGCMAKAENAAIDAINCATMLKATVERSVIPCLQASGMDADFGIRIGIDYGPEKDVLWSSYGYPGSDEVTATSFYVDVAAKLQQAAGRNQIMIGDSLRRFLDFPEELLAMKTIQVDGKRVDQPYVSPNYTDDEGRPMNYRQHLFQSNPYLGVTALAQQDRKLLAGSNDSIQPLRVTADVVDTIRGVSLYTYSPCGTILPKDKWIRFKPLLPYTPRLPYRVRCSVENHGTDAREKGGPTLGNHSEEYIIESEQRHRAFTHYEYTAYRGLHYFVMDISGHGVRFRSRMGVFIE